MNFLENPQTGFFGLILGWFFAVNSFFTVNLIPIVLSSLASIMAILHYYFQNQNKYREMKSIFQKNYVLLSAIASALMLVLQQALQTKETDWKIIGYSAFIAVLGLIANRWKGKGISVAGIIGTVAHAFITVQAGGEFSWHIFSMSAAVSVLATLIEGLKAYTPPVSNSPK